MKVRTIGGVLVVLAVGFAAGVFFRQHQATETANQSPAASKPKSPDPNALYTVAQAGRGATAYAEHCGQCHGPDLEGNTASPLKGGAVALRWMEQTAGDLSRRIREMPHGAPGSLSDGQYQDILAFVLQVNGHAAGPKERTGDATALESVLALQAGLMSLAAPQAPKARLVTARDISTHLANGPVQAELAAAGPKTTDWMFANHDYAGQRFVEADEITPANAAKLRPVCMYQSGSLDKFQANPLVYKGALFLNGPHAIFSIDAATCALNWKHDRPAPQGKRSGSGWSRGIAMKDGRIIFATSYGTLGALDAGTGALVWEREAAPGLAFTMPPMLYDDLILIGPSGSELGFRGWIGAFKLSDGAEVWRFYTSPDEGQPGGDTWPAGDNARTHSGGAIWGMPSMDDAGHVYMPVANPAPDFKGDRRPGANLYTNTMVVLDARTGKLLWHYQVTPHDTHDHDLTQTTPQFTATIDGKVRHLVAAVGKEGLLHALDKESHEPLYKVPVTTREHTDKEWIAMDRTEGGERVCPGAAGGVQWHGPAFNPKLNALFVNAVDWCAMTREPIDTARGWLTAFDAATGAVRWKYQSMRPLLAAITTTSTGVLFTGELTGNFLAMDGRDGKVLYRFPMGAPLVGGVVTYKVANKQYVATVSGDAGFIWRMPPAPQTVMVFALP